MPLQHSNENLLQLGNPHGICTICNEEITEENRCFTPCHHAFHRGCISKWLSENDACPLCRRSCDTQSLKSFGEQEPAGNLDAFVAQGAIPRPEGAVTRLRGTNADVASNTRASSRRNRGGSNTRNPRQNAGQDNIQNIIEDTFRIHEDRSSRQIREEVNRVVASSLETYFRGLNLNTS